MTFKKLCELINKYEIPENVRLKSDSGWECSDTDMDGIYYNERKNTIVFTQDFPENYGCDEREYIEDAGWKALK